MTFVMSPEVYCNFSSLKKTSTVKVTRKAPTVWEVQVASRMLVSRLNSPLTRHKHPGIKVSMPSRAEALRSIETRPLRLPNAGTKRSFFDPFECRAFLKSLQALGHVVPEIAFVMLIDAEFDLEGERA